MLENPTFDILSTLYSQDEAGSDSLLLREGPDRAGKERPRNAAANPQCVRLQGRHI